MGAVISFLVIAIVVLLILSSCIRIVPQAQALVVASGCLSGDMVGWRAFQGAVH